MSQKHFILLGSLLLAAVILTAIPAVADPPVIDPWIVEKAYDAQDDVYEYIYSLDYVRDYSYTGPIFDWHLYLGNWTPGQIEITPPDNWIGSWDGGTYGCQTNTNPYTWGNMYIGNWTIRVKAGYGDGSTTFTFTDSLHNEVAQQPGVLVPVPVPVPEPASLAALSAGLAGTVSLLVRRRRR